MSQTPPDLSIGQRLAIGFGLIFLIVVALVATVFTLHNKSVRAQAEYFDSIVPLSDRMESLERSIVHVAVDVRSVMLDRTAESMATYERSADTARRQLQQLTQGPIEPDSSELLERIEERVLAYMRAADNVAERAMDGSLSTEDDERLTRLRVVLVRDLEQFSEQQAAQAEQAVASMATARNQIARGTAGAAALATLVLLAFAWLTTRSITGPTRNLVQTARALERGDWQPALALAADADTSSNVAVRDEMQQIANAFGSAALALESRELRLRAEGEVARAVSSALERERISHTALHDILEYVGAQVGVIYWAHPDTASLHPIASHALGELAPVRFGDGVPGQAARDRRSVVLTSLPPDSGFQVRLGYDQSPPKTVAAVPLMFQDTLHGVLVVASLRTFDADRLAFLDAAASQLGIGLQNVAAYERIQALLGDLRARNEEVHAQNEELQAQNEEIQAQNEEIQAQSQQLQVQHEEIQAQNDQLRTHATMLAEADDRKNKFLGVLAHELRNPMAPISNSIFILKRARAGSEDALRAQEIIERQTRHLVRLIDDLLDVTRISEGKIHIQCEPLDLVELVRTCVEDLGSSFEQHAISLELDLPSAPLRIDGDRTRLSQVLGNLLNNSIKFNDRGGRVALSLRTNGAAEAVLRVADDGIGMDGSLLAKLFEPFSQGHTSLKRTNGGLGLGLALVKSLVELHGGMVRAHSDGPGKGAEFVIHLPLVSTGDGRA